MKISASEILLHVFAVLASLAVIGVCLLCFVIVTYPSIAKARVSNISPRIKPVLVPEGAAGDAYIRSELERVLTPRAKKLQLMMGNYPLGVFPEDYTNRQDLIRFYAESYLRPIWVKYEENGNVYLAGLAKHLHSYCGQAGSPEIEKESALKLEGAQLTLILNYGVTNIAIQSFWPGTVQVGTNKPVSIGELDRILRCQSTSAESE